MNDNREAFLEKQINLHHDLIDEMESSRLNREQKQKLQDLKILYKKYIDEYKGIMVAQEVNYT